MKNRTLGDALSIFIIYSVMVLVIIVTLYPFLNVLAISFNDARDTIKNINMVVPRKFTLDNYREILKYTTLTHAAYISVMRTVVGTATGVVCQCMLAYTMSRTDYIFRKFIIKVFVITMYVGGGLIPYYMLILKLSLNNTFWVYIIPALISTFNVIVIRSFMDELPQELQESARIDGAGDFFIFVRVVMPLCLPVIATISLFLAVGQWNSWLDTYLYNPARKELSTLQYELMKILDQTSSGNATALAMLDPEAFAKRVVSPLSIRMAVTVVVTVPILLVYPFLQKYFVTGLTLGSVKG